MTPRKRSHPGQTALTLLRSLLVPASLAATSTLDAQSVVLKDAFPGLTFPAPVGVVHAGDGTGRLFIVEQGGTVAVVNDPGTSSKTFLDIGAKVISGGELGLLGLAFHPSYGANGYFYVDYTAPAPLRTVVSRFSVSAGNPDSADPASEVVLLEIPQPYSNHNGGQLAFGPDGYLYIGTGDGGSGGDPGNRAQDRTTLLGKILRIDVDVPSDTLEYSIPPDNPYAGNTDGFREEIYSYGLRNPWRFSFDPATGRGWIGDVGQGDWEEVDVLAPGANYGWRLKEGSHCYNPPAGCDTIQGLTDPVWEYAHDASGGCSITGGYVYRGSRIPALAGKYIFGDYCSGRVWALDSTGPGVWNADLVLDTNLNITSFGVDAEGEIYLCSPGDGRIYRLSPVVSNAVSYGEGWNIVALPVAVTDGSTDTIFPDAISSAYAYVPDSGYVSRDSLRPGEGYWIKFSGDLIGLFDGPGRLQDTLVLRAGWNLVGGLSGPVDAGSVGTIPPGIVASGFFGYSGSYEKSTTLLPGRGYWVKLSSPGLMLLQGGGAAAMVPSSRP